MIEMRNDKSCSRCDLAGSDARVHCSQESNAIGATADCDHSRGSTPAICWPEFEDCLRNIGTHLRLRCWGRFVEVSSGGDNKVVRIKKLGEGFVYRLDGQVRDLGF